MLEAVPVPVTDVYRLKKADWLRGLRRRYGSDGHQIGHSYLLNVAKVDGEERVAMLEFVWNSQIVPLVEEYFYTQRENLAQLLAPFRADEESDGEADSSDNTEFELGRQTGDRLMFALHELVSRADTQ